MIPVLILTNPTAKRLDDFTGKHCVICYSPIELRLVGSRSRSSMPLEHRALCIRCALAALEAIEVGEE